MAVCVFKVDELATQIASHLLAISPRSTVALALTCRASEVPALRVLWETQDSLSTLITCVLPTDAWRLQRHIGTPLLVGTLLSSSQHLVYSPITKNLQVFERPLTAWELDRLNRYASWMRRLEIRERGFSEEIVRLVLPSSDGTPPALRLHLRELGWWPDETNLSFLPGFLSPDLTTIDFTSAYVRPGRKVEPWDQRLPDKVIPMIGSAIKMFPSSLQHLDIQLAVGPGTPLTEEISAFVLGCGESLREFGTNLALSNGAIVHLMKLPNLRVWVTEQEPPEVTELIHHGIPDGVTSLFPSLKLLKLRGKAALEWLPLFEAAKSRSSPWIMAGNSLPALAYHHPTLPMDSSLLSIFLPFTNLVDVDINMGCFFRPCVSRFTDQDVERLAIALPKLETLSLGGEWPCSADTCPTTIRSLLFLSIHCTNLRSLNIHFRMASLRLDMMDTLGYAYSHGLHSKPKCVLERLVTGEMYIELSDYDPALISMGMLMIFPSLTTFVTRSPAWGRLEVLVNGLRQVEGLAALTEKFMMCLNVGELVENGVTVRSIVSSHLSFGLAVSMDGWACSLTLLFVHFRRMK